MRIRSSYSAPQHNVGQIGQLHRQNLQAGDARLGAVSSVVTGLNQLRKVYEFRRNEREVQDFRLQVALGESSFVKNYSGKTSFRADEVLRFINPETVESKGLKLDETYTDDDGTVSERPRQDIPAYEVYPAMYRSFMQTNIPVWGRKITDERERGLATTGQMMMLQPKATKVAIDAISTQRRVMHDTVKVDVKQLADKGLFSEAHNRVKSSSVLSVAEKAQYHTTLDKKQETDRYTNLVTADHENKLTRLKDTRELLSLSQEEYERVGGKLSVTEKRTQFQMVDRELDKQERVQRTLNTARLSRVRKELAGAESAIRQGVGPDTNFIKDRLSILYASGTEEDKYRIQQTMSAMHFGKLYQQIAMTDPLTGDSIVDTELATFAGSLPNAAKFEHDWRKAVDDTRLAVKHDAVRHARPFYHTQEFDPADPEKSLIAAKRNQDVIKKAYKKNDEYFSNASWARYRETFDSLDLNGKSEFLTTTVTVMGSETEAFFESGLKKDAGPMAVAGLIAADNPEGLKIVLQGQELINTDKYKAAKDFNFEAGQMLTTAFGDPHIAAQRMSAVRAAYVFYDVQEKGLNTGLEITDSAILKKAVNATTKGIIEYNGAMIESPDRTLNDTNFETKIKELAPEHWTRQGGILGYTSKQVKEGLDKGSIHFQRAGAGKYYMLDKDGRLLESESNPGKEFVFDYNAPRYTMSMAAAHAKDSKYRSDLTNPDVLATKRQKRWSMIGGAL